MILLNPGPANTTESVKQAQVQPDICPRERSFGDVLAHVARRLVEVVGDPEKHVAVLFGGSGTAAVEATIASTVDDRVGDGRLLVIDNGAYGSRIAQIAAAYGLAHDVEAFDWGSYPDIDRIAARLANARYSHLAVVHHETTTGMLNPIDAIGALCAQRGVDMIVDAMSSYAGIPIDLGQTNAAYIIASSNKCIQGMAGIGFVIAERRRIEALTTIPGRSLYLDLAAQHRFFRDFGQMRFTPPVQTVYALAQALEEFFAEGQRARYQRYMACWAALDQGMAALGFRRLLPESMVSKIVTAYIEPTHPGYDYRMLHDALYERGFTIYPGKGAKRATFRLANMGAITPDDMRSFISALTRVIDELAITPLYADSEQEL